MTDEQWAAANNMSAPAVKLPLVGRLRHIAEVDTNEAVARTARETAFLLQNLHDTLRIVRNANGIDYTLPPQIAGLVNTAVCELEGRL